MKLAQQVVSLEIAKRLRGFGVNQESYFLWYGGQVLRENQLTQELRRHEPPLPAYTVAELGDMLPHRVQSAEGGCFFPSYTTKDSDGRWLVSYHRLLASIEAETEADARAKMLIYLLENNLITLSAA